jgi:hypothetical protein
MKIGNIPVAAIALLIVAILRFITKHFFAVSFLNVAPYFDGALMGIVFAYILYYANIYITALTKNRREELSK